MTLRDRLESIAAALPDGASVTLPVVQLRAWLSEDPAPQAAAPPAALASLRERLHEMPAESLLSVRDVAEAIGRSRHWVYRAVRHSDAIARGRNPLPCERLDGCLVFRAGAVRDWLRASTERNHR